MLYLLVAIFVIGWLTTRFVRKRMRESEFGGQAARLGADEARAEHELCRAEIAARLSAPPSPKARREIERLAERGAWMMDRARGLEGEQTGPVQRARYRIALIEAAERDAAGR